MNNKNLTKRLVITGLSLFFSVVFISCSSKDLDSKRSDQDLYSEVTALTLLETQFREVNERVVKECLRSSKISEESFHLREEELGNIVNTTKTLLLNETELTKSDIEELENEYGKESFLVFSMLILSEESHQDQLRSSSGESGWSRAGDCLFKALGGDIISSISGAMGGATWKTISKYAAKKVLKEAAKKFLGPVGLGIAAVEFTACMW